MVDLGSAMVMLYFDINACPGCILKKLPKDQRAAAVLSITSKSLVFMLYDDISDNDVLSNYPITMASLKGKLIYFSTQDASVSPTFCSLLKTANIIGKYYISFGILADTFSIPMNPLIGRSLHRHERFAVRTHPCMHIPLWVTSEVDENILSYPYISRSAFVTKTVKRV